MYERKRDIIFNPGNNLAMGFLRDFCGVFKRFLILNIYKRKLVKLKLKMQRIKMSKVVIFGAGNCGRLIAQKLLNQGEQIICFIDNDLLKVNGTITLNGGGQYIERLSH